MLDLSSGCTKFLTDLGLYRTGGTIAKVNGDPVLCGGWDGFSWKAECFR